MGQAMENIYSKRPESFTLIIKLKLHLIIKLLYSSYSLKRFYKWLNWTDNGRIWYKKKTVMAIVNNNASNKKCSIKKLNIIIRIANEKFQWRMSE